MSDLDRLIETISEVMWTSAEARRLIRIAVLRQWALEPATPDALRARVVALLEDVSPYSVTQ